jgi:hypothetical protein
VHPQELNHEMRNGFTLSAILIAILLTALEGIAEPANCYQPAFHYSADSCWALLTIPVDFSEEVDGIIYRVGPAGELEEMRRLRIADSCTFPEIVMITNDGQHVVAIRYLTSYHRPAVFPIITAYDSAGHRLWQYTLADLMPTSRIVDIWGPPGIHNNYILWNTGFQIDDAAQQLKSLRFHFDLATGRVTWPDWAVAWQAEHEIKR